MGWHLLRQRDIYVDLHRGILRDAPRLVDVREIFISVLLKLNCYNDIEVSVDGETWQTGPATKDIMTLVIECLHRERNALHYVSFFLDNGIEFEEFSLMAQTVIDEFGHLETCRLQEGRYPNYNSVIPKNYNKKVTLDKATLKSALKRVQPMGNQASNLVKIDISCNNMEVSTYDVDFNTSAKENNTCDCGEYLTIGMNSSKILSILDLIPGAIVSIDFEDQSRPWVITPEESQDNLQILALQMPMCLA